VLEPFSKVFTAKFIKFQITTIATCLEALLEVDLLRSGRPGVRTIPMYACFLLLTLMKIILQVAKSTRNPSRAVSHGHITQDHEGN